MALSQGSAVSLVLGGGAGASFAASGGPAGGTAGAWAGGTSATSGPARGGLPLDFKTTPRARHSSMGSR